ncbi:acyl-CoA thioester hydrolase/BAAT C-terminal domain-containing protein [Microbacterium saperdae]
MHHDVDDVHDAYPIIPSGTAVLLLAGSSGRVETHRADLLAAHGARVRAIRWFGGVGQRPAPHDVPLELFFDHLDVLRRDHDRVAIMGTSFGAEAALVTAAVHPVDATIALSPSSVVWSGFSAGSWSSHWTLDGTPLPAVAFDPEWTPTDDPPEYLGLYARSLERDPDAAAAAAIAVEDISGEVLLVAGGDDRVWPSIRFSDAIVSRRAAQGRITMLITLPEAGHRVLLPGETAPEGGTAMARGGTPDADRRLGSLAWGEISRLLDLRAR